MNEITTRNRDIKKTLERAFGRGKVTVRGARGTGYGHVSVHIDYTPLDTEVSRELEVKCKALLRAAKIDLGHVYTDDTCQYSTDKCHISFNHSLYHQTLRHSDGSLSVLREWGENGRRHAREGQGKSCGWCREMIALDADPAAAEQAYSFEVVER